MMTSTLTLVLAVVLLSISGSFATEAEVVMSSNATSVEIGHPFKLTCELKNFVPGTEEDYDVFFMIDNDWFCFYITFPPSQSGIPGQSKTVFINGTGYTPTDGREPSLGRQPVSSTFPVYEITVTPSLAGTKEYYCNLFRANRKSVSGKAELSVDSKHLSITATTPHF